MTQEIERLPSMYKALAPPQRCVHWEWWHVSLIPAPGETEQGDLKFGLFLGDTRLASVNNGTKEGKREGGKC